MKRQKIEKFFLIIFATFAIGAIFFRFVGFNQELWLDESGQYWIGVGRNHYYQDLTRGSLSDVWKNNHSYNFDPPLFSITIYFWTLLSISIYWLRLLPTLYGFLVILYLYRTLKLYKVNKTLVAGIITFVTGNYFLIYYSKEFRAFSLTQAFVAITLFYFVRYLKENNNSDLVKLTISNLLAMLSLYSSWLFIPSLYLVLVLKNPKKIIFYALSSIPYAVLALIIYYSQVQFQKAGFSLDYANHFKLSSYQFPDNIRNLFIFHKEHWCYLFGYSPMFGGLGPYLSSFYSTNIKVATFLFATSVTIVGLFLRKKILGKEIFLLYFFFISLICTLSFFGTFPIGPNRWNLFYVPIELLLFSLICNALWQRFTLLPATLLTILIIVNLSQYSFFPRQGPFLEQLLGSTDIKNDQYLLYSYDIVPSFKYFLKVNGGKKEQFFYVHNYDNVISHRQENMKNYLSEKYDSLINSVTPLHIIFTGVDLQTYDQAKEYVNEKFNQHCMITENNLLNDYMVTLRCNPNLENERQGRSENQKI